MRIPDPPDPPSAEARRYAEDCPFILHLLKLFAATVLFDLLCS
jgi:hypothetical protein